MQDMQINALRMWHQRQLRATARSRRPLIIAALLVLAVIACGYVLGLLSLLGHLQLRQYGSTSIDVSLIRQITSQVWLTILPLNLMPHVFAVLLILSSQSALRLTDELRLALSRTAHYAATVQTSRQQSWKWIGMLSLTFTFIVLAYHLTRNQIFLEFGQAEPWQLNTLPGVLPYLVWLSFYCFSAELATLLFIRTGLNTRQRATILLGIFVLAHLWITAPIYLSTQVRWQEQFEALFPHYVAALVLFTVGACAAVCLIARGRPPEPAASPPRDS